MPISTHAPHTGRDWVFSGAGALTEIFQPTRPIRGATSPERTSFWRLTHFNPRAPYGARPVVGLHLTPVVHISTHAPHTGRDTGERGKCAGVAGISTHAPHTGRDPQGRRRTPLLVRYFNPRAPYGARPQRRSVQPLSLHISTHAPHTGRDLSIPLKMILLPLGFQPTRPIRGATCTASSVQLD